MKYCVSTKLIHKINGQKISAKFAKEQNWIKKAEVERIFNRKNNEILIITHVKSV